MLNEKKREGGRLTRGFLGREITVILSARSKTAQKGWRREGGKRHACTGMYVTDDEEGDLILRGCPEIMHFALCADFLSRRTNEMGRRANFYLFVFAFNWAETVKAMGCNSCFEIDNF